MEATRKLNFFPPRGGVFLYYSPGKKLHNEKLDYKKHCSIPTFSYVQAHNEPHPTNTQASRTIDCIYLCPLPNNKQGGHELMNLVTSSIITRCTVTPVPITQSIIQTVEAMAASQGMKGLKLCTKTGQILYDSTWIAQVNYQEPESVFKNKTKSDSKNENNSDEDGEEQEEDDSQQH